MVIPGERKTVLKLAPMLAHAIINGAPVFRSPAATGLRKGGRVCDPTVPPWREPQFDRGGRELTCRDAGPRPKRLGRSDIPRQSQILPENIVPRAVGDGRPDVFSVLTIERHDPVASKSMPKTTIRCDSHSLTCEKCEVLSRQSLPRATGRSLDLGPTPLAYFDLL